MYGWFAGGGVVAGTTVSLSAAGNASGLTAISGILGDEMAAGVVITAAASVVVTAALGYEGYRLVKWMRS